MELFLALIGASGVGKTTIIKELVATGRYGYINPISTRAPRPDDYGRECVSRSEYAARDNRGELFNKNEVYGELYAYSHQRLEEILRAGQIPLCDLFLDGIDKLQHECPELKVGTIYVAPPSVEVLKERLGDRFNEKRFVKDIEDFEKVPGHPGIHYVIVNYDIGETVEHIHHAVAEMRSEFY
jgi:guanylate kinase